MYYVPYRNGSGNKVKYVTKTFIGTVTVSVPVPFDREHEPIQKPALTKKIGYAWALWAVLRSLSRFILDQLRSLAKAAENWKRQFCRSVSNLLLLHPPVEMVGGNPLQCSPLSGEARQAEVC